MQQTTSGVRAWNGIACDATCTTLVAVATSELVYTSTDSGATWTEQTGSLFAGYQGVASSSDGTKLVAVALDLYIQTSDDSAVTWTGQPASAAGTWWWVACDLTCTHVAAVETFGYIYTSTDSGVSWTGRAEPRPWLRIASSSDGTKLAATDFCRIWTSDDSGVTWIAWPTNPSRFFHERSRSTEKSWPPFRPSAVDFCGSRLAIGAATERARALAMPAVTRAKPYKRDSSGVAPASPQVAYRAFRIAALVLDGEKLAAFFGHHRSISAVPDWR